ncbi:MAG: futalosine hydrolase [Planctomycetota bacterium]
MSGLAGRTRGLLVVCAAPAECEAVCHGFGMREVPVSVTQSVGKCAPLGDHCMLARCGVGSAPAAVGAVLALRERPDAVLHVGVAGAYAKMGIGELQSVLGTSAVLADHGSVTPNGFRTLDSIGFSPEPAGWDQPNEILINMLQPLVDHSGAIATVAAVSGTSDRAAAMAHRTGAIAEAMEGASVALACAAAGVPFAEIRVISNIVGDRAEHPWKLNEALAVLASRIAGWAGAATEAVG